MSHVTKSSMRNRVKGVLFRRVLSRHPAMLRAVRSAQFGIWKAGRALRRVGGAAAYDPDELLWVDPRSIRSYIGDLPWNRFEMRGRVVGGDWDLKALPFDKWDLHKGFVQRFEQGRPWTETGFYKRVQDEITRGQVKWGCSSAEEFDARLARIEVLFEEIATNGYKSQRELSGQGYDRHAWERESPFRAHDEVVVCIGRSGELMLRDGKHRLSIAKILGLKRIPVAVGLRHQQWHDFRQELVEWVDGRGGQSYQPLTHPDLQTIPAQHDDGRFELIYDHLPLRGGTLLDIGAFFGYFCHRFEQAGFDCTAVENHPRHAYFLRRLRDAEQRAFRIMEDSVLDGGDELQYDVVLALNIFHHFIRTPASFDQLKGLLRRLRTKAMFFESHCQADWVMQDSYRNFSPAEFVEFILANSCLTRARHLGTVARGRDLYLLAAD